MEQLLVTWQVGPSTRDLNIKRILDTTMRLPVVNFVSLNVTLNIKPASLNTKRSRVRASSTRFLQRDWLTERGAAMVTWQVGLSSRESACWLLQQCAVAGTAQLRLEGHLECKERGTVLLYGFTPDSPSDIIV